MDASRINPPCLQMTDEDLARLCHSGLCQDIAKSELGARLVKVSDSVVVKYGLAATVTEDEAENQRFAFQNADPGILRVPRVYRYFQQTTDASRGYLVMEYIQGKTLEEVDASLLLQLSLKVASAIKHLWGFERPFGSPGPLAGGYPRGYAWSDDGASVRFKSVRQMEDYMNQCLRLPDKRRERHNLPTQPTARLRFKSTKTVFCHNDVTRRNVMITETGNVCFVDWAFAGFYPSVFEIYSLARQLPDDPFFVQPILDELKHPTPSAEEEIILLDKVSSVLTRYMPPKLIED